MFFYILVIPSLVLLGLLLLKIRKLEKHDKVLYKFCQIRRGVIKILRNNNNQLTKNDYADLRFLLSLISTTIHHYNEIKSILFNVRKLLRIKKHLFEFKNVALEVEEKLKSPKKNEIHVLYEQYKFANIYAFASYTPFFKSEIILRLLLQIIILLVWLGLEQLQSGVNYLKWFLKELQSLPDNEQLA